MYETPRFCFQFHFPFFENDIWMKKHHCVSNFDRNGWQNHIQTRFCQGRQQKAFLQNITNHTNNCYAFFLDQTISVSVTKCKTPALRLLNLTRSASKIQQPDTRKRRSSREGQSFDGLTCMNCIVLDKRLKDSREA